jgi:hypothetical protein
VCSGHLTVEQHAQHLASLVQDLVKLHKSEIRKSQAFVDFRKYIYFSSCQKINKRLEKKVRHGEKVRPFLETLLAIQLKQAVQKISSAHLPGRSQDEDSDPLQDEDPDPLQDEDWIRKLGETWELKFTLVRLESTKVQHIELDRNGIENLQEMIRIIVDVITDKINEICHVYSKVPVHPDKVTETADDVHEHFKSLLQTTWLLQKLLKCSPSLRRFLNAVPASSVFC